MKLALLSVLLSLAAAALYSSTSPVKHLDVPQYEKLKGAGTPFLVQYYSPSCPHCKASVADYEKVATALKGIVRVYATFDDNILGLEQVTRVPTYKFYADDSVEQYTKPPTADGLVDWTMSQVRNTVKKRQGKKMTGSSAGSRASSSSSSSGDVISLTESSFKTLMTDSENAWFVKFYAPWCGHCKALEPTWKLLASELQGKVKVAEVDATVETTLATRFEVRGYPTLLFFPGGKKSMTKVKPYNGPRELQDLLQFALKEAATTLKPQQLIEQAQIDSECSGKTCVIAILPHILDSSAKERHKYIKTLTEIMIEEAGLPVKYFWMEGSNNIEFERQLHLEFGWPAVVALNKNKSVYSVHRGGFNKDAIINFIRGMTSGRTPSDPLPPRLTNLKKMEKWDGKDAKSEL